MDVARTKNGVPGMSVAVTYKGEVIFAEGFGKLNEHQLFTKEVHPNVIQMYHCYKWIRSTTEE